jgi:hypothetical protein
MWDVLLDGRDLRSGRYGNPLSEDGLERIAGRHNRTGGECSQFRPARKLQKSADTAARAVAGIRAS